MDASRETDSLLRHEEELSLRPGQWVETGRLRIRKDAEPLELDLERVPAGEHDSGEIETLADGSLSIPVLEEELVVMKRTVVKERLVVRKGELAERRGVRATLRKERVEIENP